MTRMLVRRPPSAPALSAYQFLGCLERGPVSEAWEARSADGRLWLVRLLFVAAGADARRRLAALSHPALPETRVLAGGPGAVAVVSERVADGLRERLAAARADGDPGLDPRELLGWARQAADALDHLAAEHGLRHLALQPRHLGLRDGRLVLGEMGEAALIWQPAGRLRDRLSPRYAAPELLAGRVEPGCDAYALAAAFHEGLTGAAPPRGGADLEALPAALRPALARAFDADPEQRFPCCSDLIDALARGLSPAASAVLAPPAETHRPAPAACTAADPDISLDVVPTPADSCVALAAPPDDDGVVEAEEDDAPPVWPVGGRIDTLSEMADWPEAEPPPADPEEVAEVADLFDEGPADAAPTPPDAGPAGGSLSDLDLLEADWKELDEGPDAPVTPSAALRRAAEPPPPFPGPEHGETVDLSPDPDEAPPAYRRDLSGPPTARMPPTEEFDIPEIGRLNDFSSPFLDIGGDEGRPDVTRAAPAAATERRDGASAGPWPVVLHADEDAPAPRADRETLLRDELAGPAVETAFPAPAVPPWGELLGGAEEDEDASGAGSSLAEMTPGPAADAEEEAPAEGADDGQSDRDALARALAQQVAAALFDDRGPAEEEEEEAPVADEPADEGPTRFRPGAGLQALLDEAARSMPPVEPEAWGPAPEGGQQLTLRLPASLPPTAADLFEGFRRQWAAQVVGEAEGEIVFQIGPTATVWQRWLGRATGLLVTVNWTRPGAGAMPRVAIRVRSADGGRRAGEALLKELGPALLESLRALLQGTSNRRTERRLVWPYPVQVTFVLSGGQTSGEIEAQGKDLTTLGAGLYLPRVLPGSAVRVALSSPAHPQPVRLGGRFIRVHRHGRGWFEAAVLFQNEEAPLS